MGAWADLNSGIETALTGIGYTLPPDQDPERWPSWAIGVGGVARWASVSLVPDAGSVSGSDDTTRHALTVRTICGHPWSDSASQAAALNAAQAIRAAIETTAGHVSGTAHAVYEGASVERLGACYLVTVTFQVIQTDTY